MKTIKMIILLIVTLYPSVVFSNMEVKVKISNISVSSTLKSKKYDYSAKNMLDNYANAWCEGKKGSGKGEWIKLYLNYEDLNYYKDFLLIKINPGYSKSDHLFFNNERISKSKLDVINKETDHIEASMELQFNDINQIKVFSINIAKEKLIKSFILVTILDSYKGKKYKDLCISEINLSYENKYLKYKYQDLLEKKEIEVLLDKTPLNNSIKRNKYISKVQRLVNGFYYFTAEGGPWVKEKILELMKLYPIEFFSILRTQDEETQKEVENILISRQVEKYKKKDVLDSIKRARSKFKFDTAYLDQLLKKVQKGP